MTRKKALEKLVEAQVENWINNPEKLKYIANGGFIGFEEWENFLLEDHYKFLTNKEIVID